MNARQINTTFERLTIGQCFTIPGGTPGVVWAKVLHDMAQVALSGLSDWSFGTVIQMDGNRSVTVPARRFVNPE